uniref:Uncharacterized protein n=1 Tax=Muribaculaceae bacterium Z82 TaxID=2304548 RepID=A0A7C9JK03_9BACT
MLRIVLVVGRTSEEKKTFRRYLENPIHPGPFLRLSCDPLSLKTFNGPYSMRIFPFSSMRTALQQPPAPHRGLLLFRVRVLRDGAVRETFLPQPGVRGGRSRCL